MMNAQCNNCNNIDYRVLYKQNKAQFRQIVECTNCGLMYVFPLETDNQKMYWEGSMKNETAEESNSFFSARMDFMINQKEQLQIQDYCTSIKYVEKMLPYKGKALEVGASMGYFLHELEKRGWNITGIEPSDSRRDEAKRTFRYDFIPDKIEDTNLAENSLDAIFMFHVIEHILNPSETIQILYKYLKPGGILVIETPTYDSLSYYILRHRERSIRCDGHFYFFTKKTLSQIVRKNKFKILRHDKVGRTLSLERLCWNISVIIRNKMIGKILFLISSAFCFYKIKIYLNIRDMQRIYCMKYV